MAGIRISWAILRRSVRFKTGSASTDASRIDSIVAPQKKGGCPPLPDTRPDFRASRPFA